METLRGGPEKGVRFFPKGRKTCSYSLLTLHPEGRGSEQVHLQPPPGPLPPATPSKQPYGLQGAQAAPVPEQLGMHALL